MPREINMEQNDDGQLLLDDPFLGADVDEEEETGEADFGNDLGDEEETEKQVEEETEEEPEAEEAPEAEEETDTETEESPDTKVDDEPETVDDEPTKAKDNDQRIPKSRFDEVNERRKAAEKELADFKAAQATATAAAQNAYDFDAAERKYMELVVDGEFEKAQEIRKEIRIAERAEFTAVAQASAATAREATKSDLVFQDTVEELEAEYPMMVKGHEDFDQSVIDEVLSLHEGFLNQNMDPTLAIRKAVKYVAKVNDLKGASEETAPAPEPKGPSKKPVSKTDVATKVKAKTTQPQRLPKGTAQEPGLDIASLTEDEFDALPESKRREMRGDFI